jgi:hypothetical protein
LVAFEHPCSDGLSSVTMKRQYWIKEDGRWKIFYEGAA